ncbi:hypothetical protein D1632_08165 [Chryseobacterium nematophagum]|uniref:Uncharacterized protein n=1 Tax=Chryseobacterium nematophagum TaxID=2305228 RepID=A0A3M7LDM8_9FLAO|nr:hypothetical protein [Chryseobacterium nematophagum]RMZ59596.1 hypothetical protein D1632_08165 [Chryseobacterium nematophagum]
MKNLLLLFVISLQSCNGQEKNNTILYNKVTEKREAEITNTNEAPFNFLDEKYQIQGLSISDTPNPYPTYSFSDPRYGLLSVDYIGKTNVTQYFWNVGNKSGYFSKYFNTEEEASKSDDIKKYINTKDYYIIASHLPQKYILYNGGEDGEFTLAPNAKTLFYLYENNKWKLMDEVETNKIPENLLYFETSLVQKMVFKNISKMDESFNGSYSVSVETEATTTGMASISYDIEIKKNNINVSLSTYHESNLCEGKYFASINDNMLEIYYFDNDLTCISIDPKFYIKKENNKFYIKGVGGEGTNAKWILMK